MKRAHHHGNGGDNEDEDNHNDDPGADLGLPLAKRLSTSHQPHEWSRVDAAEEVLAAGFGNLANLHTMLTNGRVPGDDIEQTTWIQDEFVRMKNELLAVPTKFNNADQLILGKAKAFETRLLNDYFSSAHRQALLFVTLTGSATDDCIKLTQLSLIAYNVLLGLLYVHYKWCVANAPQFCFETGLVVMRNDKYVVDFQQIIVDCDFREPALFEHDSFRQRFLAERTQLIRDLVTWVSFETSGNSTGNGRPRSVPFLVTARPHKLNFHIYFGVRLDAASEFIFSTRLVNFFARYNVNYKFDYPSAVSVPLAREHVILDPASGYVDAVPGDIVTFADFRALSIFDLSTFGKNNAGYVPVFAQNYLDTDCVIRREYNDEFLGGFNFSNLGCFHAQMLVINGGDYAVYMKALKSRAAANPAATNAADDHHNNSNTSTNDDVDINDGNSCDSSGSPNMSECRQWSNMERRGPRPPYTFEKPNFFVQKGSGLCQSSVKFMMSFHGKRQIKWSIALEALGVLHVLTSSVFQRIVDEDELDELIHHGGIIPVEFHEIVNLANVRAPNFTSQDLLNIERQSDLKSARDKITEIANHLPEFVDTCDKLYRHFSDCEDVGFAPDQLFLLESVATNTHAHALYVRQQRSVYAQLYAHLKVLDRKYINFLFTLLHFSSYKTHVTQSHIGEVVAELSRLLQGGGDAATANSRNASGSTADGAVATHVLDMSMCGTLYLDSVEPTWLSYVVEMCLNIGSVTTTVATFFQLSCYRNFKSYICFLLHTLQLNNNAKYLLVNWLKVEPDPSVCFANNFFDCDFLYCMFMIVGDILESRGTKRFFYAQMSYKTLLDTFFVFLDTNRIHYLVPITATFFFNFILGMRVLTPGNFLLFTSGHYDIITEAELNKCTKNMIKPSADRLYTPESNQFSFMVFYEKIGLKNGLFNRFEFATPQTKSLVNIIGVPQCDPMLMSKLWHRSFTKWLFDLYAKMKSFIALCDRQALSTILLSPLVPQRVLSDYHVLCPEYAAIADFYAPTVLTAPNDFGNLKFKSMPFVITSSTDVADFVTNQRVLWPRDFFKYLRDNAHQYDKLIFLLKVLLVSFGYLQQSHNYNMTNFANFLSCLLSNSPYAKMGFPAFSNPDTGSESCFRQFLAATRAVQQHDAATVPAATSTSTVESSTPASASTALPQPADFTANFYRSDTNIDTVFMTFLKSTINSRLINSRDVIARTVYDIIHEGSSHLGEVTIDSLKEAINATPSVAISCTTHTHQLNESIFYNFLDKVKFLDEVGGGSAGASTENDFTTTAYCINSEFKDFIHSIDLFVQPTSTLKALMALASWFIRIGKHHKHASTHLFKWINVCRADLYDQLRVLLLTLNGPELTFNSLNSLKLLIKRFDEIATIDYSAIKLDELRVMMPLVDLSMFNFEPHSEPVCRPVTSHFHENELDRSLDIAMDRAYREYVYEAMAYMLLQSDFHFYSLTDLFKMIMSYQIKGNTFRHFNVVCGETTSCKSRFLMILLALYKTTTPSLLGASSFSKPASQDFDQWTFTAARNLIVANDDTTQLSDARVRVMANTVHASSRGIQSNNTTNFPVASTTIITTNKKFTGDAAIMKRLRLFVKHFQYFPIKDEVLRSVLTNNMTINFSSRNIGAMIITRKFPEFEETNYVAGMSVLFHHLQTLFFFNYSQPISNEYSAHGQIIQDVYVANNYPPANLAKTLNIAPSNNIVTKQEIADIVSRWWSQHKFRFHPNKELTTQTITDVFMTRLEPYKTHTGDFAMSISFKT